MPVQIRLLAKAAFAQVAFERSFFVVNIPHVTLQITRDAERSLAVLTLVRLLPSVRAQVTGQIRRPRKHFAAELARVAILQLTVRTQSTGTCTAQQRRDRGVVMVMVLGMMRMGMRAQRRMLEAVGGHQRLVKGLRFSGRCVCMGGGRKWAARCVATEQIEPRLAQCP